jgi:hypothetical protein
VLEGAASLFLAEALGIVVLGADKSVYFVASQRALTITILEVDTDSAIGELVDVGALFDKTAAM